jgi:hypothetical protein
MRTLTRFQKKTKFCAAKLQREAGARPPLQVQSKANPGIQLRSALWRRIRPCAPTVCCFASVTDSYVGAVPKVFREALLGAGWSVGRSPVHHAVTASDGTTKVFAQNCLLL